MSQIYAEAFLEECYNVGLKKDAAAKLLMAESIKLEAINNPARAEGFIKVASELGPVQPMITLADFDAHQMTKEAREAFTKEAKTRHLLEAGKNLWGLGKNLVGATAKGVKNTGRAAASPFRAGANSKHTASWASRNPIKTTIGALGLGGGATYGVSRLMEKKPYYDDPFFSPAGADPTAREDYVNQFYGPGISKHNQEYFGGLEEIERLKEKQKNDELTGAEFKQLKELQNRQGYLEGSRAGHVNKLNEIQSESAQQLKDMREEMQALDEARNQWWRPRNLWSGITGKDKDSYYDNRQAAVQNQIAAAKQKQMMAADRNRMLADRYQARPYVDPEPTPKQTDFYPTVK